MTSELKTDQKTYTLESDKYVCNKFGLAEFFAKNYKELPLKKKLEILDVGCGVFPLGIFLCEQEDCNVTGIDINKIAIDCACKNIEKYHLENKANAIWFDFSVFTKNYEGKQFDLIISNPPIDTKISAQEIAKFSNESFDKLNDEKYSFLTNSYYSKIGKDLCDYIFEFAEKNLAKDGKIVLVFCMFDSDDNDYILQKAKQFNFQDEVSVDGYISGKDIGIQSLYETQIHTKITCFKRL